MQSIEPEPPRCRIITVTHDSDATLAACVRGALAQRHVALAMRLVDNASRRDPGELLQDDERLSIVRNRDNPGFSVACNQGAEGADETWLLLLNPDCLLGADDLSRLIAHAEAAPQVGLVGALLLNADGSEQAASRRVAPTPERFLPWRRNRGSVAAHVGHAALTLQRVDAVSGALMLIRRALWERLGGLDPGYRLHCEDLDLCRRVQQAGLEVACATDVRVTHLKGTSSRSRPLWVEWQKHRGMWRYYSKFDRQRSAWWMTAMVACGISARFPLAAARAFWRSRFDA